MSSCSFIVKLDLSFTNLKGGMQEPEILQNIGEEISQSEVNFETGRSCV